jgi:hypothetical protein
MRNLSSTAGHRVRMPGFVAAGGTGGVVAPLADGCGHVGVAIGCDAAWSGMAVPFDGTPPWSFMSALVSGRGVAPRSGWWAKSPSRAALSLRLIWKLTALACRSRASKSANHGVPRVVPSQEMSVRLGDATAEYRATGGLRAGLTRPTQSRPAAGDGPADYRGSCLPVPGSIWPRCRWLPASGAFCRKASATTSGNRP